MFNIKKLSPYMKTSNKINKSSDAYPNLMTYLLTLFCNFIQHHKNWLLYFSEKLGWAQPWARSMLHPNCQNHLSSQFHDENCHFVPNFVSFTPSCHKAWVEHFMSLCIINYSVTGRKTFERVCLFRKQSDTAFCYDCCSWKQAFIKTINWSKTHGWT